MQEQETKDGITLTPDKKAFATEREVYQQVLTIAGVDTELTYSGSKYNAEILLETFFVPCILNRYLILTGAFGTLPSPEAIKSDPIRAFGTFLRRLGLSHHRNGRNEKGEYTVDLGKLAKLRELIIRRGKVSLKHFQIDNIQAIGTDNAYISYKQHLSHNPNENDEGETNKTQ